MPVVARLDEVPSMGKKLIQIAGRFELKDGSCKEHPEYKLKTWPVRVEDNEIIVELA